MLIISFLILSSSGKAQYERCTIAMVSSQLKAKHEYLSMMPVYVPLLFHVSSSPLSLLVLLVLDNNNLKK